MERALPRLTRRCLLQSGAAVLAGFDLLPLAAPLRAEAGRTVKPRGCADFGLFIFLGGGLSHLDSFDLKEGAWTPDDFDIRQVTPEIRLPVALFPKLSRDLSKLAMVRGMEAWETEHGRATYYLHTMHPPSPARLAEIPSLGAVVAYEFRDRRRETDILPPFLSLNYGPDQIKSGFLDSRFGPLNLNTQGSLDFIVPETEKGRFERRLGHLKDLESLSARAMGGPEALIRSSRGDSLTMMSSPEIRTILKLDAEERTRYGGNRFGDACILARNVLAADRGARFVSIASGGWDFHTNIYDRTQKSNQYSKSLDLDAGLSALLADMAARRDGGGRSLLDRTLIVVAGEFGRTTGALSPGKGRDHHKFAMSALFAGAGLVGGRAMGATDERGEKVVSGGWRKKRSIYPEDVAATIYSALGIDWGKKLTGAPSGRVFEYVEPQSGTRFLDPSEITELWTG